MVTYAIEHGIPIDDAYVWCDNHLSAWKDKDGRRPDWDQMMARLATGELGGILLWKADRFTRSPRQTEDLLDLAEAHRLGIDGPMSGRIDLTTAAGRGHARDLVNKAASESDNTSERVKPALRQMVAEGYPLGAGRIFGFERAGDVEVRESEAEVIRDMARRLLGGETMQVTAAHYNALGVTTARGGQWVPRNLGRLLGHARYGGWAELNGERLGRIPGEPILDADTFDKVQAKLAARRRGRRPTGQFPLTGVPLCGRCLSGGRQRTMAGHREMRRRKDGTRARRYTCMIQTGGCSMSALADPIEAMVRARMVRDLTDPHTVANIAKRNDQLGDLRAGVQAEIDEIISELAVVENKKAMNELNKRRYGPAVATYERRLAEAEAKLAVLDTPDGAGIIEEVGPSDVLFATPERLRQLIAELGLTITIMPLADGKARNTFNPDRVVIDPPEETR